jgi:hypothetical protein
MLRETRNPVTKTEAIKYFLTKYAHADLAALYDPGLEVQVIVAQDGGDKVDKEYNGRRYSVWTDARTEWKSFRIPLNANIAPEDNDGPMLFNLEAHVEGIGLTGWNWRRRVSQWCGFDYDSISGHAEAHSRKLTDEQLDEVKKKAMQIPWVTVRKSTGGNGIHLYAFLPEVATANHTEHAALARWVLDQMSALVGYDFKAKVDACGEVLWIWHRKMLGTDGLALIKQGDVLRDIPPDWRAHVPVVTSKRRTVPQLIAAGGPGSDSDRLLDELTGDETPLDAEHNRLIDWLQEHGAPGSWDKDKQMLITHTYWLKEAHKALGLKGPFETISTGRHKRTDTNCFAYARPFGVWIVRRYTPGVAEAATWHKDKGGWTCCYLNRAPISRGRAPGFSITIPLRTSDAHQAGE